MLIFIWLQSLTWLGARFERLNYCFFCTNQWRALVCIGPGSSRCQYGEQSLQMNKIEGPGGKSIFFPVFFWLFGYSIASGKISRSPPTWSGA